MELRVPGKDDRGRSVRREAGEVSGIEYDSIVTQEGLHRTGVVLKSGLSVAVQDARRPRPVSQADQMAPSMSWYRGSDVSRVCSMYARRPIAATEAPRGRQRGTGRGKDTTHTDPMANTNATIILVRRSIRILRTRNQGNRAIVQSQATHTAEYTYAPTITTIGSIHCPSISPWARSQNKVTGLHWKTNIKKKATLDTEVAAVTM